MIPLIGMCCFGMTLLSAFVPSEGDPSPKVTIVKSEINKDGYVQLHLSVRKAPNARMSDAFYQGTHYLGGCDFGTGDSGPTTTTVGFYLRPKGNLPKNNTIMDWRKRLRVNQGQTLSLTKGKRLYFYDFVEADRTRDYGYIEWNS